MESIINFLQNTPADWFLHPIVSFLLFFHFKHVYNFKTAIIILMAASFGKEIYDFIWATGFSWRDICMNGVGLFFALVIIWHQNRKSSKFTSNGKYRKLPHQQPLHRV